MIEEENNRCHEVVSEAIEELDPEQRSEWREIHSSFGDPLNRLEQWTPEHRQAVRASLGSWMLSSKDTLSSMGLICRWSPRLGIALACLVVREALRYAQHNESRPRTAVDACERWVRGERLTDVYLTELRQSALESEKAANGWGDIATATASRASACLLQAAMDAIRAEKEERSILLAEDEAMRETITRDDLERTMDRIKWYHLNAVESARKEIEGSIRDTARVVDYVKSYPRGASTLHWTRAENELPNLGKVIGQAMLAGPVAEWIG